MQETASSTTAMEEELYVKVGSRFFRVKQPRGGGGAMEDSRRLDYLEYCFLCKKAIDCNRDIFMYKGDAAFCSEDCRENQMDMDEALQATARRHRLLRSPPSSQQSEKVSSSRTPVMRRRPTIANLAARNPPVVAS